MDELSPVVLRTSLPEHGLGTGDVGTVVHRDEDGDAFEVEFVTGPEGGAVVHPVRAWLDTREKP